PLEGGGVRSMRAKGGEQGGCL
ncbi:hypothetical protein VCHC41B1_0323B, partial [Vibrio cholerae HC-41B1]